MTKLATASKLPMEAGTALGTFLARQGPVLQLSTSVPAPVSVRIGELIQPTSQPIEAFSMMH
eukprot:1162075-Pelagomonas_calceolata.AAC.16